MPDTYNADDLRNVLQPFGKWLRENYKQIDAQVWLKRFTGTNDVYTFNEVIEHYILQQQKLNT